MEDTPGSREAAFKKCLGPQMTRGAGKACERKTTSGKDPEFQKLHCFPKIRSMALLPLLCLDSYYICISVFLITQPETCKNVRIERCKIQSTNTCI